MIQNSDGLILPHYCISSKNKEPLSKAPLIISYKQERM